MNLFPALATLPLLACLARTPTAEVEPAPHLSAVGDEAYAILLEARRFTDSAIYVGGDPPREVIALRLLLREEDGAAALRKLAGEATIGGQLFATCGLYYADPSAFERHVARLAASDATILYQSGCTGIPDHSVRELVDSRRPDAARLDSRDQTLKEWCTKNGKLEGGYWLDIRGGGIPSSLVEEGGFADHVELDLDQGVD